MGIKEKIEVILGELITGHPSTWSDQRISQLEKCIVSIANELDNINNKNKDGEL